MRKYRFIVVSCMAMIIPCCMIMAQWASGISDEAIRQLAEQDHPTSYVNTKAPGVHKEYDPITKQDVWKTGMGSFLCYDKDMKPLHDMDRNVVFNGDPNNPDVKKVWDEDRGNFVWKSFNGDFLGNDKESNDQRIAWLKEHDPKWMDKNSVPMGQNTKTAYNGNTNNTRTSDQNNQQTNPQNGGMDNQPTASAEPPAGSHNSQREAKIRELLMNFDGQVSNMQLHLSTAQAQLHGTRYEAKYGYLVTNARNSLNAYKQKRRSTTDPDELLRIADAQVAETERHLSAITSALNQAGTASQYMHVVNDIRRSLNQYRQERQKID